MAFKNKAASVRGTTTKMEYGLTYDGGANTVGNLTGVTETGGATVDYEYDDLYRLTEETRSSPSYTRTYGYDLAGNPTTVNGSTVATFDAGNKLATIQSKAVTHDTDGNLTGIATTSPVTFKTIEWTALNKISRVYQTTGGGYIDYRYLYDGKRYYSKAATGTTARIHYIYAGDTLIGEISATVPSVAYTWGPDGLISKRNLSTSTSHWYEFGPQGETRTLRNSSGASTDTYYYNAYGEQTSSTGSTVNPYRYGGKYGYYSESYTGLVLATQRWYSPQLMRWVSRDPIGYEGGENLYEYVGGMPVYYIDPEGTDWVKNLGDASSGFGDTLTFGLTGMARENLGMILFGVPTKIDEQSSYYRAGEGAGLVHACLTGGGGTAYWLGYRTKIAFHGAHHYFPAFRKKLPHMQLNVWKNQVKGSGKSFRIPIPIKR